MIGKILQALVSALPGLLALIKAFKKKDEPSSTDIAGKATSEVEELEKWRRETRQ